MAIKKVVQIPASVLQKKAEEVEDFSSTELDDLIEDMFDTLEHEDGIGLAAPQIGEPLSVFVIPPDYAPEVKKGIAKKTKHTIYINPKIVEYGEEKDEAEEGCLSIKEFFASVTRPTRVVVEAQDRKGNKFRVEAEGLLARIFQHEIDHLNSTLFIHRLHEK